MQISERVDVVIVGAGPAGLTAACVLQAAGARILTVDAAEAGANTSRAAVIHARTLEVLDTIGVTGRLLADGVVVPVFTVRDQSKTLARLDFSNLPTRYPFTLMLPQSRTEEILAHRLAELGGHVKRRCTATGVRMTRDGASVTRPRTSTFVLGLEPDPGCVRNDRIRDYEAGAETSGRLEDGRRGSRHNQMPDQLFPHYPCGCRTSTRGFPHGQLRFVQIPLRAPWPRSFSAAVRRACRPELRGCRSLPGAREGRRPGCSLRDR